MLGKKFGPARVLPIMMAVFGSMTLLTVAAQNFAGMLTLRIFLGMSFSLPSNEASTNMTVL
jgi:predicted MFS family arabinose efflux permease